MRRALFLIVVVAVLIAGGFLTATVSQGGVSVPGLRNQTNHPEASVSAVTPAKGAMFFLLAGGALTSLIGMGVVLAILAWFVNRQVNQVKKLPDQGFEFTLNASKPNSIGGILTKHPSVTVAVIILTLIAISVGAAVALGVFTPR